MRDRYVVSSRDAHGVGCTEDFRLYQKGQDYLTSIGLYETTRENEAFYAGDQWGGLDRAARKELMATPVFNIFKRVINYQIAAIMSSDVTITYTPDNVSDDSIDEGEARLREAATKMSHVAANRWEKCKMNSLCSEALLNAAISGNGVAHVVWDAGEKSRGNDLTGNFVTQLVDNVNVIMGDPTNSNVQSQPYIIIAGRDTVQALRDEAEANGVSESDAAAIVADQPNDKQAGRLADQEPEGTKCTYIVKYWRDKDTGTIKMRKSTRTVEIKSETDTGLSYYPVAAFAWDTRKGTWIGQAIASNLIENQIFINKGWALVMTQMIANALGKTVYNAEAFPDGYSNKPAEAVRADPDMPLDNIVKQLPVANMNTAIFTALDSAMSMTKDLMGATDAALGNVKPDNTSAIIAVQEASKVPLEKVKRQFYQFIEDIGLIWADYMLHAYDGVRRFSYIEPETNAVIVETIDMTGLKEELFNCRVDVGPSAYYSQITALNTLDALLNGGYITFDQYLQRVPDGIIPDKEELLEEVRNTQMQQGGVGGGYDDATLEAMTQFLQSLPPEQQQAIMNLPTGEQEAALMQLMQQAGLGI